MQPGDTNRNKTTESEIEKYIDFWGWLRTDGVQLFTLQLVLGYLVAGMLLACFMPSLLKASKTIMTPITGLLVGLTFAWSGNALGTLRTEEAEKIGGDEVFRDWVFHFQLAILIVICTVVMWAFVGMGTINVGGWSPLPKFFVRVFVFGVTSSAIHEAWGTMAASQNLVLVRHFYLRKKREVEQVKAKAAEDTERSTDASSDLPD